MKLIKKILSVAAVSALTLTVGAFALTGCSNGTDYVFEAEDALLTDVESQTTETTMKIQTSNDWVEDGEGEEVVLVGYFATAGQTITWNVNAAADCTVTLKIGASSCSFGAIDGEGNIVAIGDLMGVLFGGPAPEGFDMSTAKGYLAELKAADAGVALKVNDSEVTMSGTLPSATLDLGDLSVNPWAIMGVYGAVHCGEYTAKVDLKAGANKIVLESVTGGLNVDKLTVNSSVEITHTAVDNSDRVVEQQPQG